MNNSQLNIEIGQLLRIKNHLCRVTYFKYYKNNKKNGYDRIVIVGNDINDGHQVSDMLSVEDMIRFMT